MLLISTTEFSKGLEVYGIDKLVLFNGVGDTRDFQRIVNKLISKPMSQYSEKSECKSD